MNKDLEAILDYCQDDEEWENFRDWLCEIEEGTEFLLAKEQKIMLGKNIDKQTEIMRKVAKNKECNHIWAVAERVRQAQAEISPEN